MQKKHEEHEHEHEHDSKTEIIQKKRKDLPRWITRSMAEVISREQVLLSTLREVIIFFIFLILVILATAGRKDSARFYLTDSLKAQFNAKSFSTVNDLKIRFDQLTMVTDFWHFTTIIINTIYVEYYYDNYKTIKEAIEDDKKVLFENKLLGVARIRQVRVRNDSCTVTNYFEDWFKSCYYSYSPNAIDKSPFGLETGTAWTYHTEEETGAISYSGRIATYDGGGYYQDLYLSKVESEKAIAELKENLWVSRNTRAIFIDFTVYNANGNLFCVCKLVFEFPPSGGIIPSLQFSTVHYLHFVTNWDYFVYGCEIAAYLFTFFYLLEKIREIMFFRMDYFLQFWGYIDLAVILFSLYAFSLSMFSLWSVDDAIRHIINSPDQYGNMEYYSAVKEQYNIVLALLLFFTFSKVFKYINFNITMGQLNNTLQRCAVDLIVFSLMFAFIFVVFAILGYLLFGDQIFAFRTIPTAMFTLLRTILGDLNYGAIARTHCYLAPVFFLSYIISVFFFLLNMFLAIINDTYADVKTELAIAPDELPFMELLRFKLTNLMHKYGHHFKWTASTTEHNITIQRLRVVLKKCGFNPLQIEMCFARYGIDPLSKVFDYHHSTNQKDENSESHIVQLFDFIIQQERLVQMEKTMEALLVTIGLLMRKIEHIEKVTHHYHYDDNPLA